MLSANNTTHLRVCLDSKEVNEKALEKELIEEAKQDLHEANEEDFVQEIHEAHEEANQEDKAFIEEPLIEQFVKESLVEEPFHKFIKEHDEDLVEEDINASPCSPHSDEGLVSLPFPLALEDKYLQMSHPP